MTGHHPFNLRTLNLKRQITQTPTNPIFDWSALEFTMVNTLNGVKRRISRSKKEPTCASTRFA